MKNVVAPLLVGAGLKFSEGVNFDRDGTLYCVDCFGSVWRMPPGGELRPWVDTGGGPNGSRFGPGGDLFVAEAKRKAILRLSTATGAVSVYADNCGGQPFRGPNDLCFGPDGTLYFTDPVGSSLGNRIGAVYAVTPDGATLVVGETFTGMLHRYGLDPARHYQETVPLATLHPHGEGENEAGPDGFAFGADGNLYVAHYGSGFVQVVAPDGEIVTSLPAGGLHPTNVAFWQDSLYVTEGDSGSIYRLDVGVREQPTLMRPW